MSNDTHLRLLLQLPASDTRSTASNESSIVPLPQLEDTSTARSGLIRHTTPITHNRRRKRSTGDLRGEDRVSRRLHAGSSRFSHPSGCRSHSTTMASLRSRMRSSGLLVNTLVSLVWTGHHISGKFHGLLEGLERLDQQEEDYTRQAIKQNLLAMSC